MPFRTPARHRGVEILDDDAVSREVRAAAMRDLERSNALFGGYRAALQAIRPLYDRLGQRWSLLDVGAGTGDVTRVIQNDAARRGGVVAPVLLDRHPLGRHPASVAGDVLRLPVADAAVDVVICCQLLHHFEDADALVVLRELQRIARRYVLVCDLRRSRLASRGFQLASFALRFHRVTRSDGVVSVMRGFTPGELRTLVQDAVGVAPIVRRGVFWRLSAVWDADAARSMR